tara:strand:- start:1232 stop:1963 length:732 start_codon:yes stop_codon:yes gene_type:complete
MNIFQYDQVVSHRNLETLISEVDVFKDKMKGNAWIGLHDEPDNPIEQFIIDSYDFHFAHKCEGVVGFEWWIHVMEKDTQMITFHADHDEDKRINEGDMSFPMLGTCLYLDDIPNPTIFFNTEQTSKYEKEIEPFPPTSAVFSYADKGKFLVYNPRYLHGILPCSDKQSTLWYNVWHYKPKNLDRVGLSRLGFDNGHYIMKKRKDPVLYLGDTVTFGMDIQQKSMTLKGPHGTQGIGDLWEVNQ